MQPYLHKAKSLYSLTKPGVLYGNAITAAAGFLLASGSHVDLWLFTTLFIGTTLIIASACVLNNYLDQDIDAKMERTKKRAILNGDVTGREAVIFSIIIGLLGLLILLRFTNYLVVLSGIVGFVTYVVFYGMLSKRLSVHGTLVGSISGAMPIFAGYVGASGQIDLGAILVFLALFFWQMPEFYSIAIYRAKEYKAAAIPVISVVHGIPRTVVEIVIYTILLVIATLLLTPFSYTGYVFLTLMGTLSIYWLILAFKGLPIRHNREKSERWARKMFRTSLVYLLLYSLLLSINALLP